MDVPGKVPPEKTPEQKTLAKKAWSIAVDVVLDCGLFVLLQYGLTCFTLSFWMHPVRLVLIFLKMGILVKFFCQLDQTLGKWWFSLLVEVLCMGVVLLLVWMVGYFPVSQVPVHLPWD